MGEATLNPPTRRACVSCGREDVWDGANGEGEWRIRVIDGVRQFGEPFCLHEWDITGAHIPVTE